MISFARENLYFPTFIVSNNRIVYKRFFTDSSYFFHIVFKKHSRKLRSRLCFSKFYLIMLTFTFTEALALAVSLPSSQTFSARFTEVSLAGTAPSLKPMAYWPLP